jgi:hypothetical protein
MPTTTKYDIVAGMAASLQLHSHSQLYRIVRGVNQILFRAEISFGRLDRSMAQEHLDLLKLAATGAA